MSLRFNAQQAAGTFNTITATNAVFGNPLFIGPGGFQKAKAVSAVLALTAATSGITFTAKWQVSNDKTTWIDVAHEPQNPAGVVLVTGTASILTKVVPAPEAIYGYAYARVAVVVGAQTGAAGDLYVIGYSYRQIVGSEE